jgi:hypothetical protein
MKALGVGLSIVLALIAAYVVWGLLSPGTAAATTSAGTSGKAKWDDPAFVKGPGGFGVPAPGTSGPPGSIGSAKTFAELTAAQQGTAQKWFQNEYHSPNTKGSPFQGWKPGDPVYKSRQA